MPMYLLLRDNKQSAYSLSEIQAKGFKKYDLVWIEGRSAAWRYPGEIDELKAFAPIVEEQPFDRFFKKPSEEKRETRTQNTQPFKKETETAISTASNKVFIEVGSKKVYATLPAKKVPAAQQPQTILVKPSARQESKQISEKEEKASVPEKVPAIYYQEKVAAFQQEEKTYYKEEKIIRRKNSQYRQYLQPFAVAVCVIALLGAGIFIGMSIRKNSSDSQADEKNIAKVDKARDAQNTSIPISTSVPVEEKSATTGKESDYLNDLSNSGLETKPLPEEKNSRNISEKKKTNKQKTDAAVNIPKVVPLENVADSNSEGFASRKSIHRDNIVTDKDIIKNSIGTLVSVSSNKYNVGTFGGISEVQLTVSNKSIYPLDLVMVEVQYVQANKKIYKTENIYYHNVRPGESLMQEAPKSSRGVKIQYKVAIVNSKEPSISYSGI